MTIESILAKYEIFLEELVNRLAAKQKKIRKTDNTAIYELFTSAHPDPHNEFKIVSLMKLSEILGEERFGISQSQLQHRAEALHQQKQAKLEELL